MKNTLNAIVFEKAGQISLREFPLDDCGPNEIVVRTRYTMVSSGTELRVLSGLYGAAERFPLIPGYSFVGEVIAAGGEVRGYRVGDRVSGRQAKAVPGIKSMWGGQASMHVCTTAGEECPVLLPAGAVPLDYVVAEIAAISWRGIEAAAPKPGETAVVLGQGLIGAFSAAWLSARGCRVIVADMEPGRLEGALRRGAAAAVDVKQADAEARLRTLCNGGADIVVETSGTSPGTMLAYTLVRKKPQAYGSEYKVEPIHFYGQNWPRLVMQANYLEPVKINPFSFFDGEGVTILAPKDRGVEDRQSVVEQLRRGILKAQDFVSHMVPFADAVKAYTALRDDKDKNFSLVFDWTAA